MEIRAVDPLSPLAVRLMEAMNDEVVARYPDGFFRAPLPVFEVFLVAGEVACGGLCQHASDIGELRRMYVAPSARGQGLAHRLLDALLDEARQRGYASVRLETGVNQPEAMRLYQSAGFLPIPAYGPYVADPQCRCFSLALK